MRWMYLVLLLAVAVCLNAAEYHDGQLYLEINLATASTLQLKQAGAGAELRISEMDGLFFNTCKGAVNIAVVNPDAVSLYGILVRKEIGTGVGGDSLAVVREFFAWEHNRLVIKQEMLFFSEHSFGTKAEAESYAAEYGIAKSKIMEVPLINSTVKVLSEGAKPLYLETPLKLNSLGDVKINGSSLGYSGEFVLKTVNGKLVLNQYLPLEQYLTGVIQNEIGNNSPVEAMKAQAVAARTHALSLLLNNRHKVDGYDLCSGTHCQVYKGKYLYSEYVKQAVQDCRDEALFIEGSIADATYHSSCGGKTDASSAIWKGKPLAHLNGVTCLPEADSLDLSTEKGAREWINSKQDTAGMSSWERGALSWEKSISCAKLAANVGLGYIDKIEILSRGRSGRILELRFSGDGALKLDNEYKIRQAFGNCLSSLFITRGNYQTDDGVVVIHPKGTIQLKGKGAGHGVGMCQIGALRMARQGKSYTEILSLYYPGTAINNAWKADEAKHQEQDAE